jgi:hypothetical protein
MSDRYYVREWREVTKEEFISVERRAGFYSKFPGEVATSSFSSGGSNDLTEICGRVVHGK